MKRFEDYKQEVILAYEKRKKEGTLPPNLQRHTAANLKKECVNVFNNRYSEKDSETFKELCGERNNAEEYFKKLNTLNADKFKALDNFLKGNTEDTKDRNIELLAWLIDFEPRPAGKIDIHAIIKSEYDRSTNLPEPTEPAEPGKETAIASSVNSTGNPPKDNSVNDTAIIINPFVAPSVNNKNGGNKYFNILPKFNKAVLSFFAAFIILCGSYVLYDKSKHQCMYWNGEQYQSIACDQKVVGATIVALDTFKLAHLKRIKDIKVITRGDIGKVHYSKVNNNVEFYTTGGENPIDNRKRLLPMTEYMYREYIEGP